MDLLRPLEWGFPITLSRNTDIPRFWMKKFFEWVDRGWIEAPHPKSGLPSAWSTKSEDVHSLIWWSKDYRKFVKNLRRDEIDGKYRQFFNMTICGDQTTELGVPELDVQLDSFAEMVSLYGAQKMQWRYSPIPQDWKEFSRIANFMADLGIQECYFSFLHSGTLTPETRSREDRTVVIKKMAEILATRGMTLLGCWDDKIFEKLSPNIGQATCVDAYRVNRIYGIDKYGLQHPKEAGCNCSMSIEPANQKIMICPHNCTFCYAAPQNMGLSENTEMSV